MTAARAALVTLLLLVGLAACGRSPDGPSGEDGTAAAATLEAQRTEVRAATATLVERLATDLDGLVPLARGRFAGCDPTPDQQFAAFRYTADARVEVAPGSPRPLLAAAPAAYDAAGFGEAAARERPGGASTIARRGDLEATLSELPGQGARLLVSVTGPCVEVPAADRDDWLARRDDAPILE